MDHSNEADERWRDVLFALVKSASQDPEFRARVEATGAVLDDLEGVLERARVESMSPSGAIACHTYWWGFQLEIPHGILRAWPTESVDSEFIAMEIGTGTGPAAPFRRRAARWIAARVTDLQQADRGAGVYVCMTWMAPNIFVPVPIRNGT